MTALHIRGGTVIDASGSRVADVGVADGSIVDTSALPTSARVIDASGCIVSTGLVDLHAHLGEPGDEAAETVESACRSAVRGGFTTVLAMPNTFPPVDTAAVVEHIRALSTDAACRVAVAGTITVAGAGERLAPLGELAEAGVRFVTDCGSGVQSPLLLRRALEYARPLGLVIAQPAMCNELRSDGQMHEGEWSSRLGLCGIPAEAEEIMVMRDIALARLTGGRLHFQTLSTAASVAIVGTARRSGLGVSAEVAAHHLLLADRDLVDYDTNKKVDPPLRSPGDCEAVTRAVEDSTIDAVVSDHTPHPTDRKERPFDDAEAGSVGLETALAATLSAGVEPCHALRALSWRPAELLGLGSPTDRAVRPGAPADLTIIDPDERWIVSTAEMATTATNCALEGREVRGRVRSTIVAGEPVLERVTS